MCESNRQCSNLAVHPFWCDGNILVSTFFMSFMLFMVKAFLMPEMAHAGKHHGQPVFVGGGNDFVVTL